jgi:hypothetical protein
MTSAFPKQLDELIEQAQRLCRELRMIPSQNKLKAALHVRSERARAVLQALTDSGFDPTEPSTGTAGAHRLHVVGDHAAARGRRPSDEYAGITGTLPLNREPVSAEPVPSEVRIAPSEQVSGTTGPVPVLIPNQAGGHRTGTVRRWPVALLAAPAFVAIWSGWVGVGAFTGFGPVHPLPGIVDGFTINSAITLPIGVETYAAYALRVWLASTGPTRARRFAKRSAIAAFVLGALGQIAYHLMTAAHLTTAPWPITTAVSCLPVVVLGFGAALAHLQHHDDDRTEDPR